MLDDVVQSVVIHFISDVFNEMLVGGDDPLVHDVCVCVLEELVLELGVEVEVLASCLLPARDILDQETVSIKPG